MQEYKSKNRVSKSRNSLKRKSNGDETDGEWIPGWLPKDNQEGESLQKESFHESGNDDDKSNECPVCQKSFARSAALICHIKQNHSYMLQNENDWEPSVTSLKEEIRKWKNKHAEMTTYSHSSEASLDARLTESEEDSGNESNHKSSGSNCQEEHVNDLGVIGGTFTSSGKPAFSILSFKEANDDLLDPNQNFSIVRQNSKSSKKKVVRKKQSKAKLVCEKKVFLMPSKTATPVSLDLSIDNSAEDLKILECFVCHSRFSNSKLLTYHHMKNHMTNDCNQCSECGSIFYDQLSFNKHCSIHRKSVKSKS